MKDFGVTAKLGTPEYYGQWMEAIIKTHLVFAGIGLADRLPKPVLDFIRLINDSRSKPVETIETIPEDAHVKNGDEPLGLYIFKEGLSLRCFNCVTKVIKQKNLNTKGKFFEFCKDKENLCKSRNFGKKSISEFYTFMNTDIARGYFYD